VLEDSLKPELGLPLAWGTLENGNWCPCGWMQPTAGVHLAGEDAP
jgi:hypothetical protein